MAGTDVTGRDVDAVLIDRRYLRGESLAVWRSLVSRQAHNLKTAGPNPATATGTGKAQAQRDVNPTGKVGIVPNETKATPPR